MNVFTSTKQFYHCLVMLLTLTILSACSLSPSTPEDTPPERFSKQTHNAAFFLNKAELEKDQDNHAWQFAALQALIAEKKFTLADSVTNYLSSQPLSAAEKSALTLLTADKLYAQAEIDNAQKILQQIDNKQLSKLGYLHFLKLQTQLYSDKSDHLGVSRTLFALTPLLQTDSDKQHYNDLLLTELSLLPSDFLSQYPTAATPVNAADNEQQFKQGWYALASLYQRYQSRPNQLIRSLADWQAHYANHPLISFMPTQLTNIPKLSPYQPQHIAVLIPLSGRFKTQGQAIQYGLLHAFYNQQQNKHLNEKTRISPSVKFHFYDTQAQTMQQIEAQFKTQSIDFVIGPLLKDNIQAFLPLVPKIPVLALNRAPKPLLTDESETAAKPISWHYAFSLSPEDEAKQAAQLIFSQHHRKPLILAADSAYGRRISEAFNEQWHALDPVVNKATESHFFSDKAKLAQFIDQVLQTDKSKRRIAQMKAITDLPLQTEVRSRRDIDAIYIISKRDELIMLKPFIDVSVSPFASSIPLYASSRSHILDSNGKQNKELSKLTFSDIPFLLESRNKTFTTVEKDWGNQSFSTLRLFALGFDSYQLIGQLMQLQNSENYTYQGLTGQLSLDPSNTLQAKLSWAKYQRGEMVEVTTPATTE